MPKFQQFPLPDAGEGLTEADLVTWRVAVGDRVEVNQPLCEIETAKSLVELPCPVDGVVTRLLAAEGDTVEVGVAICEFDIDPDGVAAPDDDVEAAAAAAASGATPSRSDYQTDSEEPVHTGSEVADGEPVATSSRVDGVSPGVSTDGSAAAPAPQASASGAVLVGYGVKEGSIHRRPRKEGSIESIGGAGESQYPVLAKPPVRKLAKELGVDLTTVNPSGPGGLVTREDVEARAKQTTPQNLATYATDDSPWLQSGYSKDGGRSTRVPVKSVRKRTAEAVATSAFTAPHVTVFHTVDVTATMNLVAKLKADRDFADVKVTPLLIVAKALLLAARRHPEINASWDEPNREIVYKHYVNLGIAAATPRGLIVPNIKDAHRLPLHALALELMQLTADARVSKTPPSAFSEGTITITNVGALGIDTGTPILNPGEAAILAFGAIRQMPWVHDGEIQIRWVTNLALSFDHRLVDGELGARVLADVAKVMNDPAHGLVWG